MLRSFSGRRLIPHLPGFGEIMKLFWICYIGFCVFAIIGLGMVAFDLVKIDFSQPILTFIWN